MNTPVEKYLLCLVFVSVVALLAKNLVRGNIGRSVDGDPRHGHRRRADGYPAAFTPSSRLSPFRHSSWGVAGALWAFVYLGAWEPLRFQHRPLVPDLVHGDYWRPRLDPGPFLGAAFILVLPIVLDQVPHALGVPISVETVSLLVFVITGALIRLLIVEPRGFARSLTAEKEKLRLGLTRIEGIGLRLRRWSAQKERRAGTSNNNRFNIPVLSRPEREGLTRKFTLALGALALVATGLTEPHWRSRMNNSFPRWSTAPVPMRRTVFRSPTALPTTGRCSMNAMAASTASRSRSRNARPATPPTRASNATSA